MNTAFDRWLGILTAIVMFVVLPICIIAAFIMDALKHDRAEEMVAGVMFLCFSFIMGIVTRVSLRSKRVPVRRQRWSKMVQVPMSEAPVKYWFMVVLGLVGSVVFFVTAIWIFVTPGGLIHD